MLTGTITGPDDLAADDFRRRNPASPTMRLDANRALVDEVAAIAAAHGATPGQVALAWVLAQGDDMIPIPGTKRIAVPRGERRRRRGHADAGRARPARRAVGAHDRRPRRRPGLDQPLDAFAGVT